MEVAPDEKTCPYCAEMIKAAAIKCKHCGEMLDDVGEDDPPEGVWRWAGNMVGWRCVDHDKMACKPCTERLRPPRNKKELGGERPPVGFVFPTDGYLGLNPPSSAAGPGTGVACPRCGGTQFKVRRKTSTKVLFGPTSLLGQARWVQCVTCGNRYQRGSLHA